MAKTYRRLLFAVVALATLLLFTPAGAAPQNAITVTPAFTTIELPEGTTEAESVIEVSNSFDSPVTLDIALKGIDQISGRLLPTESVDLELAKAARFSAQELTIAPGATEQLTLYVTNIESLPPGGHYATVVLTERSDSSVSGSLRSAISISTFVVKRGGDKESLNYKGLTANGSLFALPNQLKVSLENSGNIHTVPRGVGSISRGTQTISKGVLNESSLPLLPAKENTFSVTLNQIDQPSWLPSKISINVEYRAEGSQQVSRQSIERWYLPPVTLLAIALLAVLLTVPMLLLRRRRKTRRGAVPAKPIKQDDGSVPIHVRRVRKVAVKTQDDD